MSKKPTKFRFMGEGWKIEYLSETTLEPRYSGMTNYADMKVTILDSQTETRQQKTMLHEICHVISNKMGQPLSEEQTVAMEHGLFTFFSDNPHLLSFIFPRSE